ncbi:MAG: hypothetical protein OHK93_002788, partial [Ramalina farinacea]|nr:hypothetical protein [Ramalina farinacea]
NLYQSQPDSHGNWSWVEDYPTDLETAGKDDTTSEHALILRYSRSYNSKTKLELHSVIVQSPHMKSALTKVLEGYPGVTPIADRIIFEAPFAPFVHRWKNLIEFCESKMDKSVEKHTTLLRDTLKEVLGEELEALEDYVSNDVITFDTAWMIFEPGQIVYGLKNGQPIAARLTRTWEGKDCTGNKALMLTCEIVEWGGRTFGHYTEHFAISNFQGTSSITKLAYFPLVYHEKADQIKQQLIERGKMFESLLGFQYKFYEGVAIGYGTFNNQIKYNVKSRIIVDTYAWNRFNPNRWVRIDPFGSLNNSDKSDGEFTTARVQNPTGSDHENIKPLPLSTAQHLICAPRVRGYSLNNKKWLTFAISLISNITFNSHAFSDLVLPPEYKELILALTAAQSVHKDAFDESISGTGPGIILLLSGPPGVGKTLTAESVADHLRTPLYTISAGDLGTDSKDIESKLSDVLEMATKWNAILLLDEADAFLAQRSSRDVQHNGVASIVLRVLECYEGILFLTTNRVGDIDGVFRSRVHVTLRYEELAQDARKGIWKAFLKAMTATPLHHVAPFGFRDCDLDELAETQMNGREIRNTLKTGQLLAKHKGEALAMGHLKSVLNIEQRNIAQPKK